MNEKIRLPLGSINRMKITFSITFIKHDDPDVIRKRAVPTVRRFRYHDFVYTDININPMITLDMSKAYGVNEMYDARTRVNFGRFQFPKLVEDLKYIIEGFDTEGLYYTKDGQLYLDDSKVAPEMKDILLKGAAHKNIIVNYVTVNTNAQIDITEKYEGVVFHFNSLENFVTMTYDELIELYGLLKGINLETLGLQLFNTNEHINKMLMGEKIEEYTYPDTELGMKAHMIQSEEVVKIPVQIEPANTVPNI